MDVALMSMALSQIQLKEQVSISMLKQSMDITHSRVNDLLKTLPTDTATVQQASHPYLGNNIDLRG